MNILKKRNLNNNNTISNFEVFSLSKNNKFIKCNTLIFSNDFFFINSDNSDDFFHKLNKSIFIKSEKYNNRVLFKYKLSKEIYQLQFSIVLDFLKKNKIPILRGRILGFPKNSNKKKLRNNRIIFLKNKKLCEKKKFLVSILGVVFKFERKYLTLLKKRRYPQKFKKALKLIRYSNKISQKNQKKFQNKKNWKKWKLEKKRYGNKTSIFKIRLYNNSRLYNMSMKLQSSLFFYKKDNFILHISRPILIKKTTINN